MIKKISVLGAMLLYAVCIVTAKEPREMVSIPVKVTDQDGKPLSGVRIGIKPPASTNLLGGEGLTNDKGEAVISTEKVALLYWGTDKVGYYGSSGVVPEAMYLYGNGTLDVTVKEIKNPIPMYVKEYISERNGALKVPEKNKKIGYDLLIGDWVKPYGKGEVGDLIFYKAFDWKNPTEYNGELVITFSNPGDGLIPFEAPLNEGSKLKSDYLAPEEGYLNKWVQTTSRVPNEPHKTSKVEERNYYFRVRTVLDRKGGVKRAYYGKIYGDFMTFSHYFNPSVNDRNVECDAKNNLFDGKDIERP